MNAGQELPLRDIHLPPDPSWWPPAPGWWLLAALVVAVCLGLALWRHLRRRRLRSALFVARRRLDALRSGSTDSDPRHVVQEISVLMRRAAISFYPRRRTAALTGEDWLHFLDQALSGSPFSAGRGRVIADAPYRPGVQKEEIAPLLELCAQWLEAAARETGMRR